MTRRPSPFLPAPADLLFLLVLFALAVIFGGHAINGDGDLLRHLRVGREILAHGGLFFTDQFSWTMQGQPYVPYEWGSEIIYTLAHRAAGLPGVIVLMALAFASAYFALDVLLRHLGADPLLALGTALVGSALGVIHALARPHAFSYVAIVATMALLEWGRRGPSGAGTRSSRWRMPVAALALFAIWVNLHAGFLYGLALIGMYLAGDLVAIVLRDERPGHVIALKRHAALFIAAFAGSCINPRGLATMGHVAGYLRKDWLLEFTNEMRSPDFHGWMGQLFLACLLLVITGLALSRRRPPWPHLVVLAGTTAFALHAIRNVPLWGLTALPLLALHVDPDWRRVAWGPVVRMRAAFAGSYQLARPGVWSLVAAAAMTGLALAGGRVAGVQLLTDHFDPTVFPVTVVERARAEGDTGRLFNDFIWGGYILYAWPEQKVFIDGQTDFYGVAHTKLFVQLRNAKPGWQGKLDSLGITTVILPDSAPLSLELQKLPDWWMADSADGAVRLDRRRSS